jgi:hypothetical protein
MALGRQRDRQGDLVVTWKGDAALAASPWKRRYAKPTAYPSTEEVSGVVH